MSRQTQASAKSRRERHADPISRYVGSRIRLRRRVLRVSQKSLAAALGVSCQQVQKYESGLNRVYAGRLHLAAGALNVPVSFFFPETSVGSAAPDVEGSAADMDMDVAFGPEAVELSLAAMAVSDPQVRRRLLDLVRTIASQPQDRAQPR